MTGETQEWKKRVRNARVGFAHQLDRGFLDQATAEEYLILVLSLRWLLTGVLLLQTGIASDRLKSRLEDHEAYQLFLAQAHLLLPAVYRIRDGPV